MHIFFYFVLLLVIFNFDPLIKVVLVRLFHSKLTTFLFVLDKYYMESYFGIIKTQLLLNLPIYSFVLVWIHGSLPYPMVILFYIHFNAHVVSDWPVGAFC